MRSQAHRRWRPHLGVEWKYYGRIIGALARRARELQAGTLRQGGREHLKGFEPSEAIRPDNEKVAARRARHLDG